MPRGLAIFDMDRTLLDGRVVGALGKALGVEAEVKALSAARDRGEMTQGDVTVGIARLLRGLTPGEFDRLVATILLSKGAEDAVGELLRAGVEVAICSDSYTRATEPLARRLGIPRWAANVLEVRDGAFTGNLLPYGPALGLGPTGTVLDKREAVPLLARAVGVPLERTAVIGDGVQDALAMELCGLGISYNGVPQARAAAHHRLEGDLGPAAGLVLAWLDRDPGMRS
jgi:phosphoserine phosphatase